LPANYYLLLAGAGELEPWLRRQEERVRLLGHVDRAGIAELYAAAGVFVHPNPREPFGIAPLEAMAAGLPLVAPNAGGVLSYASPENAWLAEPTPIAFAEAVTAVFAHRAEREQRAERARQVAIEHDWPTVAARYFEVFDEWASLGDKFR
jgi:phosphatidylinositol alpha 1,6-mannosyltransferase